MTVHVRKPVVDWATDFDHQDDAWMDRPHEIWSDLRSRCPVAHTGRYGGVFLPVNLDDICRIANDPEHFSSRSVVVRERPGPPYGNPPINSDPPSHTAERRLLLSLFAPARVAALEPITKTICTDLVFSLVGRSSCDAAVDYAQHIPARVIAVMLGLPETDGDLFRKWIYQSLEASIVQEDAGADALNDMTRYFSERIAHREKVPADDMITYLSRAKLDGKPIPTETLLGMLRLILIAGIDTTWSAIGAAFWHLARSPEDRSRLARDPALATAATEEVLRYFSPVTMAREVIKDCAVAGTTLRAGEMVMLSFAAANRDPVHFPEADCFRINRAGRSHVAFGYGRHKCIGASLARMEIRVAIQTWMSMIPSFELNPDRAVVWSRGIVRGPRTVPLRLDV